MKTPNSTNTKTAEATLKLVDTPLAPPKTREGLIDLCTAATRLTIERDAARLKLDRRILDLQEAHSPAIDQLTRELDGCVQMINLWAVEHRAEEFGERQKITVADCDLEFRKGSGKVHAEVNEETALAHLLALPEGFAHKVKAILRITNSLDKKAIVAMAKTEAGAEFLRQVGLSIVVEEQFKFTPAREELTPIPLVGEKSTVNGAAVAAA